MAYPSRLEAPGRGPEENVVALLLRALEPPRLQLDALSGAALRWGEAAGTEPGCVRRVLVVGDVHGSEKAVRRSLRQAKDSGCDAVVQVGDFWLTGRPARHMAAAAASPVPYVVLDGNHEHWPTLLEVADTRPAREAAAAHRPAHFHGSVWWATRGSVWEWHGRRIGALGGSVSPDAWMPELADDRWVDHEAPTAGDYDRLIEAAAGGPLDWLVTHDAPDGADGLVSGLFYEIPEPFKSAGENVRRMLRGAVDELRPTLLTHGHWHVAARTERLGERTRVVSLNADAGPGSAVVVDLADMSVTGL